MKQKETVINSKVPVPIKIISIDGLEVKNHVAFEEFTNLSTNPWINERRYYRPECDKMLIIDLLIRQSDFNKTILNFPKQEKIFIKALKLIVEKAYFELTKLKNEALGQLFWTSSFQKNSKIDDLIIIENRKADIMALFGKMLSAEEVHKIVSNDWNIDVNIHSIESFRTQNLEKIIELQKDYTQNYNSVRLAYKKSRLEEYMWLYEETKQQYEINGNKEDKKFLKDLLESIKREVEGDLIRIEGDLQLNIEQTLNIHIQKEIYKKLPINEIIITRVALKTGVNPLLLLYKLQNSYYSKFAGFSGNKKDEFEEFIEYPSSQIYDLDKLSVLNAKQEMFDANKEKTFTEYIEKNSEIIEKPMSIKDEIIQKIKKRQEDLQKGINNVQKY